MSAPKPTPSKPLSYTPPKKPTFTPQKSVEILAPSPIPEMPQGEIIDLFDSVFQDQEFVASLKKLQREIFGETLGESIKRAKPEAPRTEKSGPMTHRPFQQFEGLRDLQRSLHKNEGK